MDEQTYRPLQEGIQLLTIILVVAVINTTFTMLNRILYHGNKEALHDNIQIGEMQDYQKSQGNLCPIFY